MNTGTENKTITQETPKIRNFDWEKAKTFYHVAKQGSFASAARFLNISQSALSRQILYLEYHLGWPLFTRHSGGVKLTRKGQELFDIVEGTYIKFKGFTENNHPKLSSGKKRRIRISTTHALATHVFNDLILSYHEEHPDIIFELIGQDHFIDVILNDVDVAIRPYDPRAEGVIQEPLFTLEKRLYASPKYIEKYGTPQKVEDLKHHHVIAFGSPEFYPYSDVNWILKLGLPENELHEPIYTANSIECMIEAANRDIGIIVSYDEMKPIRTSNLVNILPEIKGKKIGWHFIYPNYFKEDRDIKNLKEFLQKHFNF